MTRFNSENKVQSDSALKPRENEILDEMEGFERGYWMLVFEDEKEPYIEAKEFGVTFHIKEPGFVNRYGTKAILMEELYKFNMRIYEDMIHVYSLHWPKDLPLVFWNKGTKTLHLQTRYGNFDAAPGQICLICHSRIAAETLE